MNVYATHTHTHCCRRIICESNYDFFFAPNKHDACVCNINRNVLCAVRLNKYEYNLCAWVIRDESERERERRTKVLIIDFPYVYIYYTYMYALYITDYIPYILVYI